MTDPKVDKILLDLADLNHEQLLEFVIRLCNVLAVIRDYLKDVPSPYHPGEDPQSCPSVPPGDDPDEYYDSGVEQVFDPSS